MMGKNALGIFKVYWETNQLISELVGNGKEFVFPCVFPFLYELYLKVTEELMWESSLL